MPTIRLTGTITTLAPLMITRPEQGDVPLTMNVIRDEGVTRAHVVPGETIKGLLRNLAYVACVDAGRQDGELKVGLDAFYRQTAGGLTFSSERGEVGGAATARTGEPLLSLFGSATPRMTGRIIVHHAIARPVVGGDPRDGIGLPPGVRRDGIASRPELADLLTKDDRALWSRQNAAASTHSEATRRVDDAKRILGRARRTEGVNPAAFEAELEAAQADLAILKASPEFQHSVQRPIPAKNGAPAGTVYDHSVEVVDGSPAEVGLLLAAMELWHQIPRIGGGRTTGYGRIEASYLLELLGDAPLRRDRTWVPAGTVDVGGAAGVAVVTDHPAVVAAMTAWRDVEASIHTATKVFA